MFTVAWWSKAHQIYYGFPSKGRCKFEHCWRSYFHYQASQICRPTDVIHTIKKQDIYNAELNIKSINSLQINLRKIDFVNNTIMNIALELKFLPKND